MEETPANEGNFLRRHWVESLGCFAVVIILLSILVPNFMRAQNRKPLMACKTNLKNFATSIDMYATDNGGCAPTSLEKLSPQYLRMIPKCRSAWGVETPYSYRLMSNEPYKEKWVLSCSAGHSYAGCLPGFPQYDSNFGIVWRADDYPSPTPEPLDEGKKENAP